MTAMESYYLIGAFAAFVAFAAVVVWADVTTRDVREGRK